MTSVVRGMRKSYLLSDMGFKPASEIEPPADRRVAHRKTPTVSRNSRAIAKAITIDSDPGRLPTGTDISILWLRIFRSSFLESKVLTAEDYIG